MAPESEETPFYLRLSSGFLKFPPRRKDKIKSPYAWLQGKIESDGAWPYWRVHDKLYDLTDFISKHPGGKFWLEETKGSDVTESFESSHFGRHPYEMLERFYVKDADTPRNSPFTFNHDDFFMTLKRKVTPILLKAGKGPTLHSLLIQDSLLFLFLTFLILGGWHQSTLLLIMSGVSLAMASFASHNFFHQKDNWRMYIFDFMLISSKEWRISHAISHHNFPNTVYDYELEMFEPHMHFLSKPDKPFYIRYTIFLNFFLFSLLSSYFDALRRVLITRRNDFTFFLPLLQIVYLVAVAPDYTQGIINCLVLHWSAALYFLCVGLSVAHHHPEIYREGDKLPEEKDWGLLQVFATRDRGVVMHSEFLSAISFGNHTLHHLFPTVDNSKLPLLLDPFLETCEQFGIEFKLVTVWEMVKGMYQVLVASEPNKKLPNVLKK